MTCKGIDCDKAQAKHQELRKRDREEIYGIKKGEARENTEIISQGAWNLY